MIISLIAAGVALFLGGVIIGCTWAAWAWTTKVKEAFDDLYYLAASLITWDGEGTIVNIRKVEESKLGIYESIVKYRKYFTGKEGKKPQDFFTKAGD